MSDRYLSIVAQLLYASERALQQLIDDAADMCPDCGQIDYCPVHEPAIRELKAALNNFSGHVHTDETSR